MNEQILMCIYIYTRTPSCAHMAKLISAGKVYLMSEGRHDENGVNWIEHSSYYAPAFPFSSSSAARS